MASEKKKTFEIEVPSVRQRLTALAVTPDLLVGKIMKIDMTKMLRGKNIDAAFVIVKKDDKLQGEFFYVSLMPSYMKRMMRKGISWIEDSFVCPSKDAKLQFKPFMITKNKIHRKVKAALRNSAKETITKYCADKNTQDIFTAIVHSDLQKEISSKLKKVYPLSLCEIRVCKIMK